MSYQHQTVDYGWTDPHEHEIDCSIVLHFRKRVGDVLEEVRRLKDGISDKEARKYADELAEQIEIGLDCLSQGEKHLDGFDEYQREQEAAQDLRDQRAAFNGSR